jgi:uncharacterized protein
MKRSLYIGLGCICVGMAILGALLPVLPCTPWAIAASFFFSKSSPRLHRWLLGLPYLGKVIRDWETYRGVRLPIKIVACTLIVVFIGSTILFAPAPEWAKWIVGACGVLGLCSLIFVVRTIRPEPVSESIPLSLPRFPDEH